MVGSSFGGRIALELATRHPDRVRELVLLCPAYRGVPPSQTAMDFGEDEDQLIEAGDLDGAVRLNVETWLGPEATDEVRAAVAIMQRHAFEVQLAAEASSPGPEQRLVEVAPAAIAVPTVSIEGALDMDHFRTVARTLAAEIPGAELVSLPVGRAPSLAGAARCGDHPAAGRAPQRPRRTRALATRSPAPGKSDAAFVLHAALPLLPERSANIGRSVRFRRGTWRG